jgi:phosphoribosylanthranilate isomerase
MRVIVQRRRFVQAGLLAAGLLAVAPSHVPLAATAAEITVDEVMLLNVQTGKCLTIAGGVSTDNNVTALQYDCDSHPSRRWRIVDVTGSGVYQIRNVQTNKCLTIAGGLSTDNNVTALQYECDSHPSRRWTLRAKL